MTEDLRHNIWIGTDRGLARYDGSKDRFVRVTFAGLPLHVRSLVVTDNGILFFGAGTAFAYSYADNRTTVLPVNGPEKITSVFTHAWLRREISGFRYMRTGYMDIHLRDRNVII